LFGFFFGSLAELTEPGTAAWQMLCFAAPAGKGDAGAGHLRRAAAREMLKTQEQSSRGARGPGERRALGTSTAQGSCKGRKVKNSWCFKQGTLRGRQIQWWA